MIKLELKFGDSSVILSADVQDLRDLKPEMKRFIEIVMEHLEPVLISFVESKLLQKESNTAKVVEDLEKGPISDCMTGHA